MNFNRIDCLVDDAKQLVRAENFGSLNDGNVLQSLSVNLTAMNVPSPSVLLLFLAALALVSVRRKTALS